MKSTMQLGMIGLGKHIRDQYVMMRPHRVNGLRERDEIARNQPCPLMDQLIERVLTVGPRLSPVNRTGIMRDILTLASN